MIKKAKRVDIIKEIEVHGVLPEEGSHIFMVHTHGMEKYGLPNLLIESSEIFTLMATSLLNAMCDWLINDVEKSNVEKIKSDTVSLGGLPNMEFTDAVYDGEGVWKMVPSEKVKCSCCDVSDGKPEGVTTH
jgi:hypothetical protein